MRNMYVVAYDIADDKRRTKVFQTLSGHGEHLQFSVFRCPLDATGLARLSNKLRELTHQHADQVLFFDLGPADGEGANPSVVVGRPCLPIRRTAIIV